VGGEPRVDYSAVPNAETYQTDSNPVRTIKKKSNHTAILKGDHHGEDGKALWPTIKTSLGPEKVNTTDSGEGKNQGGGEKGTTFQTVRSKGVGKYEL